MKMFPPGREQVGLLLSANNSTNKTYTVVQYPKSQAMIIQSNVMMLKNYINYKIIILM